MFHFKLIAFFRLLIESLNFFFKILVPNLSRNYDNIGPIYSYVTLSPHMYS